jgi:hypothetical protein
VITGLQAWVALGCGMDYHRPQTTEERLRRKQMKPL